MFCGVPNRSRWGAYTWSILLARLPYWDLPPGEPCQGPRCVNHARARGRGGCQPPFKSWQVEGRAEATMVLTTSAQEVTLNEKWHRVASRRDRKGKELGGGPAVSSELNWVHGRYCEDDTHD